MALFYLRNMAQKEHPHDLLYSVKCRIFHTSFQTESEKQCKSFSRMFVNLLLCLTLILPKFCPENVVCLLSCCKYSNIYILIVVAFDVHVTNISICLQFSMQNIELSCSRPRLCVD